MSIPGFREELIEVPHEGGEPGPVAEAKEAVAELVSARARRWVYALYALGSVILGAIQVGYSAGGFTHPIWLTIATAVWVFLGGSQGLLALLKTPLT
ncbi:hypothetical protein ACN08Y_10180 [Rothia sp. P5764]|uniref:hypothetical protein n=1 Tax=Rothia sp. P5764 TaxID=3402654 RepID=UPI003AD5D561